MNVKMSNLTSHEAMKHSADNDRLTTYEAYNDDIKAGFYFSFNFQVFKQIIYVFSHKFIKSFGSEKMALHGTIYPE